MKKRMSLFLCVIAVLVSAVMLGVFAHADGIGAADGVPAVFVNGAAGADANDGSTAEKAVASISHAIELINGKKTAKGVIVVCGATNIATAENDCNILPDHTAAITLTSFYNNVDYRTSGAIINTQKTGVAVTYFNGEFEMDYVSFQIGAANCIFAMQYNNFHIGKNVTVLPVTGSTAASSYPILLAGYNKTVDKAVDNGSPRTFKGNCTVTVEGGDWHYYRGGDRDTLCVFSGTLTTNIKGGVYHMASTDANYNVAVNNNGATGKGIYTKGSKVIFNLISGEFNGVDAYTYVQPNTPKSTSEADITVNIYDGFKVKNHFAAIMQGTQQNGIFNGTVTVNVYGGDFSELKKVSLANRTAPEGGTGKTTVNYVEGDAKSKAAYDKLIAACGDEANTYAVGTIKASTPSNPTAPDTGDNTVILAALAVVCVASVAALVFYRKHTVR